ncbi:fructosamine kinase family protein [Subtercola lobariae]|uniref:Fructosamine kinase n=1 Tax=Subtercola lobariae TaxID=1588641 RepID=A0A917F028_9MICO|nr:fructosamine kinase family protein [Subtercola lobariae]GGF29227.1 fructosamine kinase [Subtercola lobariae]
MLPRTFEKRRADAPPGFFEAEAAGLRWLADARGVDVVEVLSVDQAHITIRRVAEIRPAAAAARQFGRDLAATHNAGAIAFGAPPHGYDGPLFIGRRALPAAHSSTWGVFYANDRVRPYLNQAEHSGYLSASGRAVVERACDRIATGEFDDDDVPSRIHGDLWSGNVLWSPSGVVLIDPAAHGGHRETDLAMLALFGCPFLEEILAGYHIEHALKAGWQNRVALHQLHPLAVHAAGHGPSYGAELTHAAEAVLAL